MELRRDWQHCPLYLEIHINCSLHSHASLQLLTCLLDLEVAIEDLLKDQRESLLSGLRHIHDLEMAHESWREGLAAAARRSCSADDCVALDLAPAEVSSIVKAIHIDELSKQLNRWLSTIELFLGHVDIIDEDEELSISLHAPHLLSLAHKFALDIGLSALAFRLG